MFASTMPMRSKIVSQAERLERRPGKQTDGTA
jgi:hypothetical protein